MKVAIRILPVSMDLRTFEQQAEHLVREAVARDAPIEQLWRERVAENIRRRRAAITNEGGFNEFPSSQAA